MGCSSSSPRRQASPLAEGPPRPLPSGGAEPAAETVFASGDLADLPANSTYSKVAAQEFTRLVIEKAQTERESARPVVKMRRARMEFDTSHRELLGRCWELRESTELGVPMVCNVVPSVGETHVEGSLGVLTFSHTQRDFGSPTLTASLPDLHPGSPLSSHDGCTYMKPPHRHHHIHQPPHEQQQQQQRQQQGERSSPAKAVVHQSQWVSLVSDSNGSWWKAQNVTEPESRGEVSQSIPVSHSKEIVYNSHKRNSGCSIDFRDRHGNPTQCSNSSTVNGLYRPLELGSASYDASEFPFAGAKDVFAFRLSEWHSEDSNASFLQKQHISPNLGVRVRRWDRVELLYPKITGLAIPAAPARQNKSVDSFCGSVVSPPSELRCRENISSTMNSLPLYESFAFGALRRSSVPGTEDRPFPNGSVHCHRFALPPQFVQDIDVSLDMTPSPSRSCLASNMDLGSSAEKRIKATEEELFISPHAHLLPQTSGDHNGEAQTTGTINNRSHSNFNLPNPRHQSPRMGSAKSPNHNNSVISVVVNCFEVSIDPFNWKKNKFTRTPVEYNTAKPAVRQRVGDGVVTSVMYGGVCIIECSSSFTVKEFENIICSKKSHSKKSFRAVSQEIKKIIRDGVLVPGTISSAHGAGQNSGSFWSEDASLEGGALTMSSLSCRIIQRIGGIGLDDAEPRTVLQHQPAHSTLHSPVQEKGIQAGMDSNLEGNTTCVSGPWMTVKAMAALMRLWAAHVQSHAEFADPIAVFVQRFTGILPSLLLGSDGFGFTRLFEFESDTESSSSDVDRPFGKKGTVYLDNNNGEVIGTNGSPRSVGSWKLDSEAELEWRAQSNSAFVPSARSLPLPVVLHTGRALTILQEDEATSLSHRKNTAKRMSVSTALETSTIYSVVSSTKTSTFRKRTQGKYGGKSTKSKGSEIGCALENTNSTIQGVLLCNITVTANNDEPVLTGPSSLIEPVREKSSTPSRLSRSRASSITQVENEVQWRKAFLELKALDAELQELEEVERDAEEQLAHQSGLVNRMQSIFLPNAVVGNFLPICAYLEAVLDDPGDIPEQCLHLDTPDWLQCAAVILTKPGQAVRVVKVAYTLTMQSLPSIGMLAGLLFCEHAMSSLHELVLRCDKICAHASISAAAAGKKAKRKGKDQGLFNGAPSSCMGSFSMKHRRSLDHDDSSSVAGGSYFNFPALRLGPLLFLTPKQLSGVLYALGRAVTMNANCADFSLHLRGFPKGDPTRVKTAARLLAAPPQRQSAPRAPDTTPRGVRGGGEEGEAEEAEGKFVDELPCWAHFSAESLSPERRAVLTAWCEAERRAHCMLLRQRRPERSLLWRSATATADAAESWCYGLGGSEEERSVVQAAEELLWQAAADIFSEVQRVVGGFGGGEGKAEGTPFCGMNGHRISLRR